MHGQRRCGRTRSRLTHFAAAILTAATLPAALAAPAALAQASARTPARAAHIERPLGHPAGVHPAKPVPHAAAMRAAQARARATGRAVVVGADTTQTSQISANPNGSFTDIIHVLPVRVRQHGRWVPVSARLTHGPRNSWHPAAPTDQVRISGGGSGPLAVLSSPAGSQMRLWFPGRLPAPVIHGATATYRSIRPGVDLQVTAGDYGSVTEKLVVHAHADRLSSWLRHLAVTYRAPGLRLAADKQGDVLAAGHAGAVFTVSAPVTSIPVRGPQLRVDPASRALAAGPPQSDTTARARVTGHRIVLPASIRQLPARITYPITISTTVSADAPASPARAGHAKTRLTAAATCPGRTTACDPWQSPHHNYVEAQDVQGTGGCQTTKNWDSSTVTKLGIGYNAWDSCIGVYQSYYLFGTGTIIDPSYVFDSATLQIPVVYSAFEACDDPSEPVYLHSLGRGGVGAVIGPNTDGADMPNLGTSSAVVDTPPAENAESPACPSRSVSFNVLSEMNSAKSEGADFWNFGLSGNNATDGYGFMRLSDNPALDVEFDEAPAAPTVDQSAPPMMLNPSTASTAYGCSTAEAVPWIGGTTSSIALNATFTAALTGENVMPDWAVSWATGSASYGTPNTAQVAQGEHSYSLASPIDGDRYTWKVGTNVDANNTKNPDQGSSLDTCTFAYDKTPPTTPSVTSGTFPPLNSSPGTTQTAPGGAGTFSFTADDPPPAGCTSSDPIADTSDSTCLASGVYEFEYSLNQPPSATPTPLGSGGTDNCTAQSGAVPATNPTGSPETSTTANPSAATTGTSCSVSISQWGTNILYVEAFDQAGNVSQTDEYEFYVPFNQSLTVSPGDVNGDGIPDLLATDTSGDLQLYAGGSDPGAGLVTASPAADSPPAVPSQQVSDLTWSQLEIAHRGSWSGGTVDDVVALDQTDGDLFLYKNSDTATDMFENGGNVSQIYYPTCSQDCTDYPDQGTGWAAFNQILVPGDAWAGESGDTGQPSLLAVDASTGSLWLFQGAGGGQLENPVELGSSGWNDVTLLAPGDVNGQLTLWARINSGTDAGDVVSFPLNPSESLGTPTSGTILDNTSGSPIQLPQSTYPLVASPGPLSGGTCSSSNVMACPGLYAVSSSGELVFYGGQATTTPADALTGSSVNVGEIGTDLTQLS